MSRVEAAYWTALFLVLGTGLIMGRGAGANGGWLLILAGVAYAAAAYFLFIMLVREDDR